MLNVETRPVTWWFALFTGIAAWLLALFCPFLAIRFRVAPVPGDEEDIAVGLLSIYGSPLALAAGPSVLFAQYHSAAKSCLRCHVSLSF
jgi:hypothetical protein